jgi:hypothetical protein
MPPVLRGKSRRRLTSEESEKDELTLEEPTNDAEGEVQKNADIELEKYAKEVLDALIKDNLPPTPNNFSLYFDRLLENRSDIFKKQVHSILELEESNDAENTIILEQNLNRALCISKIFWV